MTAVAEPRRRHRSPEAQSRLDAQTEARRAARVEDVDFLLRWERDAEQIARRAGFTNAAAAERYMVRCGRSDLANRLRSLGAHCDPYQPNHAAAADRWCGA